MMKIKNITLICCGLLLQEVCADNFSFETSGTFSASYDSGSNNSTHFWVPCTTNLVIELDENEIFETQSLMINMPSMDALSWNYNIPFGNNDSSGVTYFKAGGDTQWLSGQEFQNGLWQNDYIALRTRFIQKVNNLSWREITRTVGFVNGKVSNTHYEPSWKFYGPGTINVSLELGHIVYQSGTRDDIQASYTVSGIKSSIFYTVEDVGAQTQEEELSKLSVSLDNDGNRLAMGLKEAGSNAVIRVYEFDGADWQQLGSDIE